MLPSCCQTSDPGAGFDLELLHAVIDAALVLVDVGPGVPGRTHGRDVAIGGFGDPTRSSRIQTHEHLAAHQHKRSAKETEGASLTCSAPPLSIRRLPGKAASAWPPQSIPPTTPVRSPYPIEPHTKRYTPGRCIPACFAAERQLFATSAPCTSTPQLSQCGQPAPPSRC